MFIKVRYLINLITNVYAQGPNTSQNTMAQCTSKLTNSRKEKKQNEASIEKRKPLLFQGTLFLPDKQKKKTYKAKPLTAFADKQNNRKHVSYKTEFHCSTC